MTEQETGTLAERLTRVWGCTEIQFNLQMTPTFEAKIGGLTLTGADYGGEWGYQLTVAAKEINLFWCPLASDFSRGAQWLPFFRRGCWLSGCAIECSAHEKLEWVQGFDKEVLESWNLKF